MTRTMLLYVERLSLSLSLVRCRSAARSSYSYVRNDTITCILFSQSFVPPHLLGGTDDTFSVREYRRKKHALTKL